MNEFYLAFSAMFKYKIKNTKYKKQKQKHKNLKVITKIQNAEEKCKTQQNKVIIASINITNIVLYSEYIPSREREREREREGKRGVLITCIV